MGSVARKSGAYEGMLMFPTSSLCYSLKLARQGSSFFYHEVKAGR